MIERKFCFSNQLLDKNYYKIFYESNQFEIVPENNNNISAIFSLFIVVDAVDHFSSERISS